MLMRLGIKRADGGGDKGGGGVEKILCRRGFPAFGGVACKKRTWLFQDYSIGKKWRGEYVS